MRLDTRYMDTFLAVCETGGIARAAEQLHLTQPAVSHRIRMLEREFNTQLFDRKGKRIYTTESGEKLRRLCSRYLNELTALQTQLNNPGSKIRETLRIGAVSGFGRYLLFPLLCEKEYDYLRLHLTYPIASDIFRQIEEGMYHLGFTYHKKQSHLLQFQPVYREELVMIYAPDQINHLNNLNELSSFQQLPFITYDESDYVFGKWFEFFFGRQPRTIQSAHHFEEIDEVIEMVVAGKGFSIIPDYTVREEISKKQLNVFYPKQGNCFNQIFAVISADRAEDETIAKLLRMIRNLN